MRPIINWKKLNLFLQTVHFKMEGTYMLRDLLKPGDWLTKVDLKDAPTSWFLLLSTTDSYTPFQLARADIPVQLPAIRPVISSLGLYQDHKTCYCHPLSIRSEGNNKYRRHTDHGGDTNAGRGTHHSRIDISPGKPGIHHKLPQICPNPNTKSGLPRLCNQFLQAGNQAAWRENQMDQTEGKETLI